MTRLLNLILCTLIFLLLVNVQADEVACAGCNCSKNPEDWNAIGRVAIQPDRMSPWVSSSFLVEAGQKHFRGSGTLGMEIASIDRFKVTAEWLIENNTYGFCSSEDDEWINQGAVGVAYQHLFCNPYILSFDMGGSYSHAHSKDLCTVPCSNQSLVKRRIAGANAYDVSFGTTLFSWNEGLISLYVTYDRVIYQKKYFIELDVKGFGGGATFYQPLGCGFDFTGCIELRQPYNYFEADLNWTGTLYYCDYTLGLFAAYTDGKHQLTNDGKAGIQISFLYGGTGGGFQRKECPRRPLAPDFDAWVRRPAVYRPKVLAIKDQDCIMTCAAPYTISPSLEAFAFSGVATEVDGGELFFGSNMTFALSGIIPQGVTFEESTGLITVGNTVLPGVYQFNILAHNNCGAAQAPVILTVVGPG